MIVYLLFSLDGDNVLDSNSVIDGEVDIIGDTEAVVIIGL